MEFFSGLPTVRKILSSSAASARSVILVQFIIGFWSLLFFLKTQQTQFLWVSLAGMLLLQHVGHNAGLHRYFTHNAFKTSKFWHVFLCYFSCLVCSGSPLSYTVAHRAHHLYVDTSKDPHHPGLGFFRVAFFWWDLNHLPIHATKGMNEKWIQHVHSHYVLIIVLFWVALALLDVRLAMAYSSSVMLVMLGESWVNYCNHRSHHPIGYRNFETKDNSSNDLIAGFIFGEWHNNHHKFPSRYNEKVRWWEFDMAAQFIKAIKK